MCVPHTFIRPPRPCSAGAVGHLPALVPPAVALSPSSLPLHGGGTVRRRDDWSQQLGIGRRPSYRQVAAPADPSTLLLDDLLVSFLLFPPPSSLPSSPVTMLAVWRAGWRPPTAAWRGGRMSPSSFSWCLSTTAAAAQRSASIPLPARPHSPVVSPASAVYVHPTSRDAATAPVLVGLLGALEAAHTHLGFFRPVGGLSKLASSPAASVAAAAAAAAADGAADPHVRLVAAACPAVVALPDRAAAVGVSPREAMAGLAGGAKGPDAERLLDTIATRYEAYRAAAPAAALVVAEGGHLRSVALADATAFHAAAARSMGAPMLLVADGRSGDVDEIVSMAAGAVRQVRGASAEVLSVLVNRLPLDGGHGSGGGGSGLADRLAARFAAADIPYAGALPYDRTLGSLRMNEVAAWLGADVLGGATQLDDSAVDMEGVFVATLQLPALLATLATQPGVLLRRRHGAVLHALRAAVRAAPGGALPLAEAASVMRRADATLDDAAVASILRFLSSGGGGGGGVGGGAAATAAATTGNGLTVADVEGELRPGALLITAADRLDVLAGALLSGMDVRGQGSVAGMLLTGPGDRRAARDLLAAMGDPTATAAVATAAGEGDGAGGGDQQSAGNGGDGGHASVPIPILAVPPVLSVAADTFNTVRALTGVQTDILPSSTRKVERARLLWESHIDTPSLVESLTTPREQVLTPHMFQRSYFGAASASGAHIVLPEGTEPRILRAAAEILRRGVLCSTPSGESVAAGVGGITLLGKPNEVYAAAEAARVNLDGAVVVDPTDTNSPAFRRYADRLAELRAHKGVTVAKAVETLRFDVNMFGTLMVEAGDASGMVSGAAHTTASTIRPALQLIKAATPGGVVSSVFLMLLPTGVLVYGDCAIVAEPTVSELADIAVTSAATAAAFGLDPRVALISYATGDSTSGPAVDKVRGAVAAARAAAPSLPLLGPVQYDAAVDAGVAAKKIRPADDPDGVGGRANVLVFPSLSVGNSIYKAVQRSSGAVAVGPILQGLRIPGAVNDLSRGARVEDIVNTIAVTAVVAAAGRKAGDAAGATSTAAAVAGA